MRLADAAGEVVEVALPVLQTAEDFMLLDTNAQRPLPSAGVLDRLPEPAAQQA